jgi:Lactonase, 7-bladed beta-propeller
MPYVSTDRTGRYLFTASYGGDQLAVSRIGESGLVEAEPIQVIPTGRNAHSILPDRSNKFVYAATLGANQVLQFTFDSKTGKLTPNDPAAVSPEPGHGLKPDHGSRPRNSDSPALYQRYRRKASVPGPAGKVRCGSILLKNPVWNGRDSGWRWLSAR